MRLREREHNILEKALAAFTRATGLPARIMAKQPKAADGRRPDATIKEEFFYRTEKYNGTCAFCAGRLQRRSSCSGLSLGTVGAN